jgi:hypothetical protein
MAVPQRLWARKLADAEISACLWHDRSLKEATCEISVRAEHSEDTFAANIADAIKVALDERGAVAVEQETQ